MVTCPWCFERIDFWVDPGTQGEMVEDCEVCCRPWRVRVARDDEGNPVVQIDRS